MKIILILGYALIGLMANSAAAQFSGPLDLTPSGCQQTGTCLLTYDLKYTDPNGLGWQAAAQNTTDGASIPRWAQPFIGDPFDESYLKAAVIYDHYCERHVRTWRATHRVFYDALLELGLDPVKAKLMYYAVYLGGPKWIKLIPGRDCGENCEFDVAVEGAADLEASGVTTIVRPADYDEEGFIEELKEVEQILSADGSNIDLESLERRAKEKRPNGFFYQNEGEVEIDGGFEFK